MTTDIFVITGEVEIFKNVASPWYFVRAPEKYSELFSDLADRGLIAITATVGDSTWKTSLMPMGDGTHFVPLPKKVRNAEGVELGQKCKVTFELR